MRCLWFEEATWEPLDESDAIKIEEDHMRKFKGMKLESVAADAKGIKSGDSSLFKFFFY